MPPLEFGALPDVPVGTVIARRSELSVMGLHRHPFSEASVTYQGVESLLLAGSDAQGLRYGTVGTPETLFVEWRDEEPPTGDLVAGALLDRPVAQMLRKDRLLDLIRNFVIFDAGIKKVPRHRARARPATSPRTSPRYWSGYG